MLALYTNLSLRLRRDEKGATAVEYGIMVALIAVVIIAVVTLLGGSLSDMFLEVQCQISGGEFSAAEAAGGTEAAPTPAVPAECTPAP